MQNTAPTGSNQRGPAAVDVSKVPPILYSLIELRQAFPLIVQPAQAGDSVPGLPGLRLSRCLGFVAERLFNLVVLSLERRRCLQGVALCSRQLMQPVG